MMKTNKSDTEMIENDEKYGTNSQRWLQMARNISEKARKDKKQMECTCIISLFHFMLSYLGTPEDLL